MNPRLQDQETPGFGEEKDGELPKSGKKPQASESPRRRRNRYSTASRRNRAQHAAGTAAPEESRPDEGEVATFEGEAPASRAPREGGEDRHSHPEESPRAWAKFVTIAALVFLALIIWVVVF
jgi:hypothetical protein